MRLRFLLLVLIAPAAGCLWTPKPYANDPLVRHRRAILGDPAKEVPDARWVEPAAPPPPTEDAP